MTDLTEYLISTDDYKKPSVIKDKDALAVLIIRLLIMRPGTNPLHPEMGVGIVERYRYSSSDNMPALNSEIEQQIRIFLPNYRFTKVECTMVDGNIDVEITIDDTLYSFTTQTDDSKLLPGQIKLSDGGY